MSTTYQGLPRDKIPWYPRVDYDLCIGCRECYDFCPHNVYEWDDEENHPVVANPYNCVVWCQACGKGCDQEAISFPSREEIRAIIDALRRGASPNQTIK